MALVNGDFETGDLTGWTTYCEASADNSDPYEGTYCSKIGRTAASAAETIFAIWQAKDLTDVASIILRRKWPAASTNWKFRVYLDAINDANVWVGGSPLYTEDGPGSAGSYEEKIIDVSSYSGHHHICLVALYVGSYPTPTVNVLVDAVTTSDPPPDPPVAGFTFVRTGVSVAFTDTSTNTPTTWDWDWGDGTAHGATQNPTHVFPAGSFTVTLTATNAGGSDTYSITFGVIPATSTVVTKSISDAMYRAELDVEGIYSGAIGDEFAIDMPDHTGTLQRVFHGTIRQWNRTEFCTGDMSPLIAYSNFFFLTKQYLDCEHQATYIRNPTANECVLLGKSSSALTPPGFFLETSLDPGEESYFDPRLWLIELLGGASDYGDTTGIIPHDIQDNADYLDNTLRQQHDFKFHNKTTKYAGAMAVVDYLSFRLWEVLDSDGCKAVWAPWDSADSVFHLPAKVTFTKSTDTYVFGDIKREDRSDLRFNRVTVRGYPEYQWETILLDADPDTVTLAMAAAFQPAGPECLLIYNSDTTDWIALTAAANDNIPDNVLLPPFDNQTNDALYIGRPSLWGSCYIMIGIPGVGTWTVTWEYWNGATWSALSGVSDGTSGFTAAAGTYAVTWTIPTDAATITDDNGTMYWIRARVSACSAFTTQPRADNLYVPMRVVSATIDGVEVDPADCIEAGSPTNGITSIKIANHNAETVLLGYPPKTQMFEATEDVAGVESGGAANRPIEAPPFDSRDENADLNTQALTTAYKNLLFAFYTANPAIYTATLIDRVDLRLGQLVRFTGYNSCPDEDMRIVRITYRDIPPGQDYPPVSATIDFMEAETIMLAQKLKWVLRRDRVSVTESMIQKKIDAILNPYPVTVQAVSQQAAIVENANAVQSKRHAI